MTYETVASADRDVDERHEKLRPSAVVGFRGKHKKLTIAAQPPPPRTSAARRGSYLDMLGRGARRMSNATRALLLGSGSGTGSGGSRTSALAADLDLAARE